MKQHRQTSTTDSKHNSRKHKQQKSFFVPKLGKGTLGENKKVSRLNFYHQNLCGITGKRDELELYLEGLDERQDFVLLTEHFLNKTTAPNFKLSNHKQLASNGRASKKRGGAMILGKSEREYDELKICKQLYESLWH